MIYDRNRKGYKRYGRSYWAEEHIREAEEFSKEIGGYDADVKDYFFSLPEEKLEQILVQYGKAYGEKPESYARETYIKWRKGTRKMSGMVAKRLFSLLPSTMPLEKKYELAENIWKHFAPSSKTNYKIGAYTDIESLINEISTQLDNFVIDCSIPTEIKKRFSWLAQEDIQVEEQFLNYFRHMQKNLSRERIKLEIPVLQRQMIEHPEVTSLLKSEIHIHKHIVSITIDKKLNNEIIKDEPLILQTALSKLNRTLIGFLIFVCFIIWMLFINYYD